MPAEDHENTYHTDLLQAYGIQFYWEQEAQVTGIVGQERPFHYGDAFWNSPLYQGFRSKGKYTLKGILNGIERMYYRLNKSHFLPWEPPEPENTLLTPDTLRDGTQLLKFKRFGNGRLDWSDHLPVLLSEKVVQTLLKKQGCLIAYVHLGSRFANHDGLPLSAESIRTLKRIARHFASGELWINTTSRLLSYNYIRQHLDWSVQETDDEYLIRLHGVKGPLVYKITPTDLGGITFTVPADKAVKVIFQNQPLPVQVHQNPDHNDQYIIVPIPALEWPLTKSELNSILKEIENGKCKYRSN